MINANLNLLTNSDDELFNRVVAYGPGDGINRMGVVVEDQTSIQAYGLRETVEEFTSAVDVSDLTTQANALLAEKKDPRTEVEIEFYSSDGPRLENLEYEGEAVTYNGSYIQYHVYGNPHVVTRGDTIRIVSQDLELNFTGVIQELDWEPGRVSLFIGRPSYNLLDVINGPEEDEERKKAALGLPAPVGLRAQRAQPGCKVFVNPYVNSRATGVEIYAGSSAGFTPSVVTLQAKGASTQFELPQLTSGQVFYFKARSYDSEGNYSDVAGPVSAVSGYVQGGRIEGGTIDLEQFVSNIRPIVIVSNLPTVLSGDTDYPVGTLVNYNGSLFELVSQTGDPNVDWQPAIDVDSMLDGAVSTDKLADLAVEGAKIADGTITAGKILAGAIGADQIGARSILAKHLVVGDFENLALSGGFEDEDWADNFTTTTGDQDITFSRLGSQVRSGSKALKVTFSSAQSSTAYLGIGGLPGSSLGNARVFLGDEFYFRVWYRNAFNDPATVYPRLYVQQRSEDGSFLNKATYVETSANVDSDGYITSASNSTYQEYWIKVEVTNTNTSYLWFSLLFPVGNADGTAAWVDDIYIRRMNEGNLIVDGSITAKSIASNTIIADNIDAASIRTAVLDADVIKAGMVDSNVITAREIDVGTITANEIDAKTITANEIANSTITNSLILDGEIKGAKISGGTIKGTNIDEATIDGVNLIDYIIGTDQMANDDIEITNNDKNNGTIVVKDGSTPKVAMGKITGYAGVPNSIDYGFWGNLGTGIVIPGALKLESIKFWSVNQTDVSNEYWPSGVAGDTHVVTSSVLSTQGSYTLEEGEKIYTIGIITEYSAAAFHRIAAVGVGLYEEGFVESGPGPGDFQHTFVTPPRMRGVYLDSVAASTYEPLLVWVNILIRSYGN